METRHAKQASRSKHAQKQEVYRQRKGKEALAEAERKRRAKRKIEAQLKDDEMTRMRESNERMKKKLKKMSKHAPEAAAQGEQQEVRVCVGPVPCTIFLPQRPHLLDFSIYRSYFFFFFLRLSIPVVFTFASFSSFLPSILTGNYVDSYCFFRCGSGSEQSGQVCGRERDKREGVVAACGKSGAGRNVRVSFFFSSSSFFPCVCVPFLERFLFVLLRIQTLVRFSELSVCFSFAHILLIKHF